MILCSVLTVLIVTTVLMESDGSTDCDNSMMESDGSTDCDNSTGGE